MVDRILLFSVSNITAHRYSIHYSIKDLEELVIFLGLSKFHLLGHSFGGILAYEYVKSKLLLPSSRQCLSLIIANAPCNMRTSIQESSPLEEEITFELTNDMPITEKEASSKDATFTKSIKDILRRRHECRTQVTPEPLVSAIEHRGKNYWSAPEAVINYVASSPPRPRSLVFFGPI